METTQTSSAAASAGGGINVGLIAFTPEDVSQQAVDDVDHLKQLREANRDKVIWINVAGDFDADVVRQIGEVFNVHQLAVEDVVSPQQRGKVEEYGDHVFVVAPMVSLDETVHTDQLCMFFGDKFLLTFGRAQARDCINELCRRVHDNIANIRKFGADHLAYSLLDAVIDGYFPVLDQLGDRLEDLDSEITEGNPATAKKVHEVKRQLLIVRRNLWQLRDTANVLYRSRSFSGLIANETRFYLRDCLDHAIYLLETADSRRDLCSDLMNMHLSAISNRMNAVMKVLTIITTLFIPPTLIAGIYGMNFQHMPELGWSYGYSYALVLMVVLMIAMWAWLWWRGMLSR